MKFTRFSLRTLCLVTVLAALVIQYARPFRETRLAEKLRAPCQMQWANKPLSEGLAELAEQHGIRIDIDPRGLLEEGLRSDTPLSINLAQPYRLKDVLSVLLEPLCLRTEIRTDPWHGQYLIVSSELLLDQELLTESFDVAALTARPDEFANDSRESALLRQDLVQLLYESVDPPSWEQYGGKCKLVWKEPGRTLEVTQTRRGMFDVHDLVSQLRRLREKAAGRAWLARLASSDRRRGTWTVYRLAPAPARSEARLRPVAAETTVSRAQGERIDSVVHDPCQMLVVDDELEGLYGVRLDCFRLCGQTADARFDILLDDCSPARCGVRVHLGPDHELELGLEHTALVKLRELCEEAFAGR